MGRSTSRDHLRRVHKITEAIGQSLACRIGARAGRFSKLSSAAVVLSMSTARGGRLSMAWLRGTCPNSW